MNDRVGARVDKFARRIVDAHLPVLVGLMAEQGDDPKSQSQRASKLVSLLRSAEVVSSLDENGRPLPLRVEDNGVDRRLIINGQMLSEVDDNALASAMAEPVAELLDISPVAAGLVLQVSDDRKLRGLAGRIAKSGDQEVVTPTGISELVSWRLETFEKRIVDLVAKLGGWLESPGVERQPFVETLADCSGRWPQWRQIADTAYVNAWMEAMASSLEAKSWAAYTEAIGEIVWESVAISPRSALRQAAQTIRGFGTDVDGRKLLEGLAKVFGASGQSVDDSLGAWPAFEELVEAWKGLWREEDDALGTRRRFTVPEISVFDPPGETTGFSEPENLPWGQPLLCWTMRERDALRDLFQGMEKTLARTRAQFRVGRLSENRSTSVAPLDAAERETKWTLGVPRKVPELADGFSSAVDRSYAAMHASYHLAFANLEPSMRQRAVRVARGAYAGYLSATKPIWARRLSASGSEALSDHFETALTALCDAVEWPVFVDVFEEGIESPSVATMPRFTVPAVWYGDADYAPVWIPVEAIGQGLDQASLRIRNVVVDDDDNQVRWIGDFHADETTLAELRTAAVLRSIHEGTLLVAVTEL